MVYIKAKKKRQTKATNWMPDEVVLLLDVGDKIIGVTGWALDGGTQLPERFTKRAEALAKTMRTINTEWADLHGKNWRITLVEVCGDFYSKPPMRAVTCQCNRPVGHTGPHQGNDRHNHTHNWA